LIVCGQKAIIFQNTWDFFIFNFSNSKPMNPESPTCSLEYKHHLDAVRPLLKSGDFEAFREELIRYWNATETKTTRIFTKTPGFAKVDEMNKYVEATNPDLIQSEIDYF
jgi:hypothetical protein